MSDTENGTGQDKASRVADHLQLIQGILREMGSKEMGGDLGWMLNYVYRLRAEVDALEKLAAAGTGNPTHESYP